MNYPIIYERPESAYISGFAREYTSTWIGGNNGEITDNQLIIRRSLVGARILDAKLQDGLIKVQCHIPNGDPSRNFTDDMKTLTVSFDKDRVKNETLTLKYQFNELVMMFDLKDEYIARKININYDMDIATGKLESK